MQIIKSGSNINFLGARKITAIFSVILVLASIISLATRGLNFGIDFTGGNSIEVRYEQSPDLSKIKDLLRSNGLDKFVVQYYGTSTDVLIRIEPSSDESGVRKDASAVGDEVLKMLKAQDSGVVLRNAGYVGPQVGEELKEKGGLAVLFALICVAIYILFRFEWRFSLGAFLALVHDVLITLGVFSFLQVEFDLRVLAAALAVIGYSLNDTIVVYDRIRENFRKLRSGDPFEIANSSINQTLARTVMTSLTTLMVLLALFTLGGEVIYGFSLALIIGVAVGTYSSIFIASATVLALGLKREDMLPIQKEELEAENRP